LLSGRVERILDLRPSQTLFVDRVVIPSIVTSAVTVWGEDLLSQIPMLPIRRFDVFKAFFGFSSQALLSAAVFPLLSGATRYAMATLKRSVHNCYFCYHGRRASLEEEVNFFQRQLGPFSTLVHLLALRGEYRRSFSFRDPLCANPCSAAPPDGPGQPVSARDPQTRMRFLRYDVPRE